MTRHRRYLSSSTSLSTVSTRCSPSGISSSLRRRTMRSSSWTATGMCCRRSRVSRQARSSATAFFHHFLDESNPDGSENVNNINRYSPRQINEFYDTRVDYDPVSKRFAILSAAREGGSPDTRFYAFAVSKTEDPRDGFHQYMTTETNYRDFPRLTMNGDLLLVAHNAANSKADTDGDRPVLSAYHLPSLRQGSDDPPNWQYYSSDLNDAPRVFLVSHRGNTSGLSFVTDIRGDVTLRVAAFVPASEPHLAPAPIFAST